MPLSFDCFYKYFHSCLVVKGVKKIGVVIIPLIVLIFVVPAFAQESGKTKKKSTFWSAVKEAVVVEGGEMGIPTRNRFEGEFAGLGAGGLYIPTPRSHVYDFEVTRNNAQCTFLQYGEGVEYWVALHEANGTKLDWQPYMKGGGNRFTATLRSGRYRAIISARRYERFRYRVDVTGPIANIVKTENREWSSSPMSFGPDGSGGIYYDDYWSSRNHFYTLVPKLDETIDVTVTSNNVPVDFIVAGPGNVIYKTEVAPSETVRHAIFKASQRGEYLIAIATLQRGARAEYTLNVAGNLEQNPQFFSVPNKEIKEAGKPGQQHIYELVGVMAEGEVEVVFRSGALSGAYKLTDANGMEIVPFQLGTPGNSRFKFKGKSPYRLTIDLSGNPGNYELTLMGAGMGEVNRLEDRVSSAGSSVKPETPGRNQIRFQGQITSHQHNFDFSEAEIKYSNADTGEDLGQAGVDNSGKYELILEKGQKYTITASASEKILSNSINIDLTNLGASSVSEVKAEPIVVLSSEDVGQKLVLNNIFFETASAVLLRASYTELKRVAAFLKANPGVKVEIAGHTDSVGDDASNQVLSRNRANSVLYYLQDQIDDNGARLRAAGYGKREPRASNDNDAGRQLNRRVEFRIVR